MRYAVVASIVEKSLCTIFCQFYFTLETRGHKVNFNEVEILATETWENPRQLMDALHTKLNKTSINKTWEVSRCYQGLLETIKPVRAIINR